MKTDEIIVGATDIALEETVPASSKEPIGSLGGEVDYDGGEVTSPQEMSDRLVELAMEASGNDSVFAAPDGVDNFGEDNFDEEDLGGNEPDGIFPRGEICMNPAAEPTLSREVRFGPIALTIPTKAGLRSKADGVRSKTANLRSKIVAGIEGLRSKVTTGVEGLRSKTTAGVEGLRSKIANFGTWLNKIGSQTKTKVALADEGAYTPYFATVEQGLTANMLLELTNTLVALSPNAQYFTLRVTDLGGRLRMVAKCASFTSPMALYPSCAFDAFCRIIEAFEGGEYVVRCLEDWLNIEFIAKTVRVENHIVYVDGRKVGTYLECFSLLRERGSWSKGLLGWLG